MQAPICIERAWDGPASPRRLVFAASPPEDAALSDHPGPWSVPPTPTPNATRTRAATPAAEPPRRQLSVGFLIWLGLIGAAIAAFLALQAFFPGQLGAVDQVQALRGLGLLALVSSGLVYARRIPVRETVRNIAIWAGIAAIVLLGYSYRTELTSLFDRVRGEVIPAAAVQSAPHTLVITASDDGGFYIQGAVNGAPVRFAIDTGANGVVLSPADAQRAGIDVAHLDFTSPNETANGVGFSAPVTARALNVGTIALTNVPVEVDKAPMTSSLLGMSFLRRLDSFEVQDNHLTLKWRG